MLTGVADVPVLPRIQVAQAWPAPGAMVELRRLLLGAQRPFVIVGGSGWTAESVRSLQRFAETWQLPVGCAFRFQDAFDNRHPHYAGDVGIGVNPKLAARLREADLVLAIGARLGEITTGGYAHLAAPRPVQRLVHLHAGAEELGRVYAADLLIQSSLAHAGQALASLEPPPGELPWAAWTVAARADYEANQLSTPVEPVDMAEVVRTIARRVPEDTVYTNGAGNFSAWLHRFLRYPGLQHHGRTQLAPTSGAMGYGVPAAIAASLLHPQRTVVNLAGDGDFLMTGQELATARAHGAGTGKGRLVSIVIDNGSYGTIRMHQEREYPARVSGSNLVNPDFVALARAYGWRAWTVQRTGDFAAALDEALDAPLPGLIHLRLDIEQISPRSTISSLRANARPGA
jgi:acetolactate synthase-1/2/3 large subunit